MKKTTIFVLLSSLFLLGACTNSNNADTNESTKEVTEVEKPSANAKFSGTLTQDAQTENDGTVTLTVNAITATNDPGSLLNSMKNDGVILHVEPEQLAVGTTIELKAGSLIEFQLTEQAIMTMSIPPQVPGNSIVSVKLAQ